MKPAAPVTRIFKMSFPFSQSFLWGGGWNADNFNDYYDTARKQENVHQLRNHSRCILCEGDIRDEENINRIFTEHTKQPNTPPAKTYAGTRQYP